MKHRAIPFDVLSNESMVFHLGNDDAEVSANGRKEPRMVDQDAWKRKNGSGFVIGGDDFINPDYLTHAFTHLSRFMGWKGNAGRSLTLHDLRHTVATTLISEGADVKTVQSVLGHSSAAVTLDMYASADRDAKKRAAALLDRAAKRRPVRKGRNARTGRAAAL